MRATPFDCASAEPDGDTVAIAGSSELHAMTALATTLPLLSTDDAVKCVESPIAVTTALSGAVVTRATCCTTNTRLVSACAELMATMRAVPVACATALPPAFTVETPASRDVHVIGAPGM